jgi:DNA-binding response OmpR family regulator
MPIRVMVVNDTQEILELFRSILTAEGYEVTLHAFSTNEMVEIKQCMPDLLILDFVIGQEGPGWQLLQKLKMSRDTAQIPVVICSGAVRQLRELDGWLGEKGVGIVLKPFDIDDLLVTVRKMLNSTSSSRARSRSTVQSARTAPAS